MACVLALLVHSLTYNAFFEDPYLWVFMALASAGVTRLAPGDGPDAEALVAPPAGELDAAVATRRRLPRLSRLPAGFGARLSSPAGLMSAPGLSSRRLAGPAYAARPARSLCLRPRANSRIICVQNAGRSSGLRLDTTARSTIASRSTQWPPALRDVGPQARIRGHREAVDHAGFDHGPGPVADHGDRHAPLEALAHEVDGALVHAQLVGVGDAARQHEPLVVVGARVVDGAVDRHRVALLGVVHGLYGAVVDRE